MSAVTNQAAITSAIQAAAAADLSLLQAFATANGGSFVTIENNMTTLASQMSSLARAGAVLEIRARLALALNDFQTLISSTVTAQTAVPVV